MPFFCAYKSESVRKNRENKKKNIAVVIILISTISLLTKLFLGPAEAFMKRMFYAFVAATALIAGISFAYQNSQSVTLSYYYGMSWSGPLSIILLAVFAAGAFTGYLASLQLLVRMQRQLVQARKEVRQAEQEVANLRALPIKDVL
jgi:lipopolysaccharide assembly protein A